MDYTRVTDDLDQIETILQALHKGKPVNLDELTEARNALARLDQILKAASEKTHA